ncbi:MAG: TPM domain-containing protein [Blastocatellia bacterium]|nr:TPM domain-containing protein [Blastocatellia bacterium]
MRIRLAIFVLLLWAVVTQAAETPIPPTPDRWVTDTANFLSADTARSLDARLAAYERTTGHQLLVYIGKTTGDAPLDDWAVRAFKAWQVGRKGLDDGLVLFLMADDRKLRIEVGYGLEAQVTDARASRIINEIMVPRIQAGNRDEAVTAGVDAIVQVTSGQGLPGAVSPERAPDEEPLTIWHWIFYGILGVAFVILLITNPSLAFWLLINILSSNRRNGSRGGGGWGGGGFSGGGGRSGGGGASGSW